MVANLKWKMFLWKLSKGFLSGLSGSVATLTFIPGEPSKYFLAIVGAAIGAIVHGGASAIDQLKPSKDTE